MLGIDAILYREKRVEVGVHRSNLVGAEAGVLGEIDPTAAGEDQLVEAVQYCGQRLGPHREIERQRQPGIGNDNRPALAGPNRFSTARKLGTPEDESLRMALTTVSRAASGTLNWYWTKPRRP